MSVFLHPVSFEQYQLLAATFSEQAFEFSTTTTNQWSPCNKFMAESEMCNEKQIRAVDYTSVQSNSTSLMRFHNVLCNAFN